MASTLVSLMIPDPTGEFSHTSFLYCDDPRLTRVSHKPSFEWKRVTPAHNCVAEESPDGMVALCYLEQGRSRRGHESSSGGGLNHVIGIKENVR